LYYVDLSPPCRSVLLTAAAIGVELELRVVDLFGGEHLKPEFVKLNPGHTVPTLDDNGFVICDSHAICTYLVEKYALNDSLYPKDLQKRTTVDARLHFDSAFLFCRARFLFEPVFYDGQAPSQDRVEYIQKAWPLLEGFLTNGDYLAGNALTIADLCAVATVSSVNETAKIDAAQYPRLTAWLKRLSKLPYYQKTNENGAAGVQKAFKESSAKNIANTKK